MVTPTVTLLDVGDYFEHVAAAQPTSDSTVLMEDPTLVCAVAATLAKRAIRNRQLEEARWLTGLVDAAEGCA